MKYLLFFLPVLVFAKAPSTVEFKNPEGKTVGQAEIAPEGKGVVLRVKLKDLPPGPHAFHVHETGKCDGPKFESAGAHYNPTKAEHGAKGPHAGDFENILVKEDGTAEVEIKSERLTLGKGKSSLRKKGGTALIVHAAADDGVTQPSGNAGDRIACAVIN